MVYHSEQRCIRGGQVISRQRYIIKQNCPNKYFIYWDSLLRALKNLLIGFLSAYIVKFVVRIFRVMAILVWAVVTFDAIEHQ